MPGIQRPMDVACAHPIGCSEEKSPKQVANLLCTLTTLKTHLEPNSPQAQAADKRIEAILDKTVGEKTVIGDGNQPVKYRDLIQSLINLYPNLKPESPQAQALKERVAKIIEHAQGNGGGCGTTDVPIPVIDDPVPRDPLKTKFPKAHPRELVHQKMPAPQPAPTTDVNIYPGSSTDAPQPLPAEHAKFKLVDVFRNNYYNFFEAKKPTSGAEQVFTSDPTAVQLHTDWLERELNRTSRDVPTAKEAEKAQ